MNRREVLLASGVTLSVAIAGCTGGADDDDGTGNGDDETDPENGDANGDENEDANGDENGTDGDEDEASISITEAALQTDHAEPGEVVDVDVTLENSGGAEGDIDLEVTANGSVQAQGTKTVAANSEITETKIIALEDEGEYEIAVNEVEAGTLTIEAA